MRRSFIALKFNGAIPDAIAESQKQKKLLIVYISGQDDASARLENDVWTNSQVVDVVSKFCVLLHIHDGTSDAAHFSAIYPQKSFPSITVVGYNGVLLWQIEGVIEAENLATNIEKSWLSLNIQAATASYIAGALCSKSQDTLQASTSTSSSSSTVNLGKPSLVKESCEVEEIKTINQVIAHVDDPEMEIETHSKEEVKFFEANEEMKPTMEEKPSGITLSIRLPDRSTLLEKFTSYDTLEDVKSYVDSKVDNLRDYHLALPYPRKVFLDEDLNKSLLELDLLDRQAIIMVPKEDDSSKRTIETQSQGGYFVFVGRLFSYINPFNYFPRANTTNPAENSTKASSTTRIGSNVHTLKHDDEQSDDRNQYWNGNSTQYGDSHPK